MLELPDGTQQVQPMSDARHAQILQGWLIHDTKDIAGDALFYAASALIMEATFGDAIDVTETTDHISDPHTAPILDRAAKTAPPPRPIPRATSWAKTARRQPCRFMRLKIQAVDKRVACVPYSDVANVEAVRAGSETKCRVM